MTKREEIEENKEGELVSIQEIFNGVQISKYRALSVLLFFLSGIFGITAMTMLQQRLLVPFEVCSFLGFFFLWIGIMSLFASWRLLETVPLGTFLAGIFTVWVILLSRSYFFSIPDVSYIPDKVGPIALIILAVLQGIVILGYTYKASHVPFPGTNEEVESRRKGPTGVFNANAGVVRDGGGDALVFGS